MINTLKLVTRKGKSYNSRESQQFAQLVINGQNTQTHRKEGQMIISADKNF